MANWKQGMQYLRELVICSLWSNGWWLCKSSKWTKKIQSGNIMWVKRGKTCACASHIKYHVGVFFQVYFKSAIWIYWMRTAFWNWSIFSWAFCWQLLVFLVLLSCTPLLRVGGATAKVNYFLINSPEFIYKKIGTLQTDLERWDERGTNHCRLVIEFWLGYQPGYQVGY